MKTKKNLLSAISLFAIFTLVFSLYSFSRKDYYQFQPKKNYDIQLDTCNCSDSFYIAVIDKATFATCTNDHRLHFAFYENKRDYIDSLKIEGWRKDNGTGAHHDPVALTLIQANVPAIQLNIPYRFRDIEVKVQDLKNLIGKYENCDYQIWLIPFQDTLNCLNIRAQLYYDCSNKMPETYTQGSSITLNPCPPKQPQ